MMGDIGSGGSGEFFSGLPELPLANATSPHTPDEAAANAVWIVFLLLFMVGLGGWGGFAFYQRRRRYPVFPEQRRPLLRPQAQLLRQATMPVVVKGVGMPAAAAGRRSEKMTFTLAGK